MSSPTLASLPSPDLVIDPEWIIPIEPAGVTLHRHSLVIGGDRIVDLLPTTEAASKYPHTRRLALPGEVLLPGFVNLHTHAGMTMLRGFADDLPLMSWLQDHIWPAERRHASADFVEDGTFFACAEMLRGGVTCFNDMYFFPEAAAKAVDRAGIRAALGIVLIEFPTAYATDADDYLAKGLAARSTYQNHPLISFCLAPHAPYTVSNHSFEKVGVLAAEMDLPIHIHLHETKEEISESLKHYGIRPLQRLHALNLVDSQLIAVHAVHLEASELDLLARQGVFVAHCPSSNLKLGSGIAPVAAMEQRGIRFGFGTDSAASNNRLDMFHELRHAALLAKGSSGNTAVLNAHHTLKAATLDGASALGLDRQIGSLLTGKQADICSIKLNEWDIQPCYDPASHLVYVAGREHVQHVWVAGNPRVSHGKLVNIDERTLLASAHLWHNLVSS